MSIITTAWRYKVPLAFAIGAAGLYVTAIAEWLFGLSGFLSAMVATGLATVYLVLGGAYAWSLRAEERMHREIDKRKELIEEVFEDNGG